MERLPLAPELVTKIGLSYLFSVQHRAIFMRQWRMKSSRNRARSENYRDPDTRFWNVIVNEKLMVRRSYRSGSQLFQSHADGVLALGLRGSVLFYFLVPPDSLSLSALYCSTS